VREVVITGAVRTAIGKFGGTLAAVPATELGAVTVREALARSGVRPADVDEVIMGQVLQVGAGLNPARQAALKAGVPVGVPAFTVNKVCASGMKAVSLAAQSVAGGEQNIVVAGGMENMSAAPFLLPEARWGYGLGSGEVVDSLLSEALTDPGEQCHMGITAENIAADMDVSRRDQDEFAALSQQKAAKAISAGRFQTEIVPVEVPQRKGDPIRFGTDEHPRPDTTVEVLAKLKPAFKEDGTVTAGNASGINDGAAAMVVMARDEADRRGIQPMAAILGYASAGVEPTRMGLGPVPATVAVLGAADISLGQVDAMELNEAFAAQSLGVIRELELPVEKVNVNGGAIALGHPVGASGARILVTLLHILRDRDLSVGLATLCIGGGQGMAMVVKAL